MYRRMISCALTLALLFALGMTSALAATKTVTIRVQGMKCKMCAATLTKALMATDGVADAQVSQPKGEAVVTYDDQKLTVAKLHQVINKTGFKAVEEKPADTQGQ